MNTTHTPGPWYAAKTGNHQGLIICQQNGANVAVAYDKSDTNLIAAAPALLAACQQAADLIAIYQARGSASDRHALNIAASDCRAAIAAAEGNQ